MHANEQREKRLAVNIDVNQASHDLFYSSQIMNISKGGVFIKADLVLPVGSAIDFTFHLPKTNKRIEAKGVVVWSRKALAQQQSSFPNHPSGMGIQFVNMATEAMDWIKQEVLKMA